MRLGDMGENVKRLLVFEEQDLLPGVDPEKAGLAQFNERAILAEPAQDVVGIRIGQKLRLLKNREGSLGTVLLGSEVSSLLLGTWEGVACPIPENFAELTLDRFLIWDGNRLALEAAKAIVVMAPIIPMPLLIHAGPGLGKTHLLAGIGHAFQQHRPQARIAYLTAQSVFEQLFAAIKGKNTVLWRREMQNLDLLLLDDVQKWSGMKRTQDELETILDGLLERGGLVVACADQAFLDQPGFAPRLADRLSAGLTVGIELPRGDEGIVFLLTFIAQHPVGGRLLPEVSTTIASREWRSLRHLNGFLNNLRFENETQGMAPSLEMVAQIYRIP